MEPHFQLTNVDTTDWLFFVCCITFFKTVIINSTSILEDSKTHKVKKDAGSQHRRVWNSFFPLSFIYIYCEQGISEGKLLGCIRLWIRCHFWVRAGDLVSYILGYPSMPADLLRKLTMTNCHNAWHLSSKSANLIKCLIREDQMIFTHEWQASQNGAMYFQRRWTLSSCRKGFNSLSY
jgi:hypothetical protein